MPSPLENLIRNLGKGAVSSRRPHVTSYDPEEDRWGENRLEKTLKFKDFVDLYNSSDIARRYIDLIIDYAFRNGLLTPNGVDGDTLEGLKRLFKGVRIFGESVALIQDEGTFQVVFPTDAEGQAGYTVEFKDGVEVGIKVKVNGSGMFTVKVGKYVRVMSDIMSPSDPYSGVSAFRNQYWNILAHSECVHALCGQIRIMSGGFFYWNISDTTVDLGTNGNVGSWVEDALKRKLMLVKGDTEAPEPKILTPTGATYSMVDFLDYLIKLIGAEVGLPAVMLKGSDDGKLASSDVTLRVWYDRVRSYQDRISTDVAAVLGVKKVEFADPAGVESDTATKVADALLKLKDLCEKETLEELASRLMPNITWRIKDVSTSTGPGTPSVGPLGGGDPVATAREDGVPGPAREKADGVEY